MMKTNTFTKEDALAALRGIYEQAIQYPTDPEMLNAAREAIMGYAKIAGWIVDRKEIVAPSLSDLVAAYNMEVGNAFAVQ